MLCPLPVTPLPRPFRWLRHPWAARVAALVLMLAALPAARASTPAPVPGNGQQALFEAARQWVGHSQQLQPGQVRIAPLDSRVRVEPCDSGLQFDYPFSQSQETVRVRCQGSRPWQLFLRLMPPANPETAPPLAPTAVQAMAPTAQPTAPVPMRPVVVTRRLIQRGTVLDSGMVEVVSRPAQGLDALVVGSLQDVEQAESIRDLPAGTVLRSYDIKRALMVRKGQTALLTLGQGSGFQVTVRVEAQQDGYMGEQIRLKNTESGRLLSGVVTGPNAVRGLQN